jgi:nitric oxide reductase large subunit
MTIFGLISAYYYLDPDFLFGILPFNIAKIVHINTLVISLLMGFMASIYWFLPGELGRETAGIRAAEGTVKLTRSSQNAGARGLCSCRVGRAAPLRRCF